MPTEEMRAFITADTSQFAANLKTAAAEAQKMGETLTKAAAVPNAEGGEGQNATTKTTAGQRTRLETAERHAKRMALNLFASTIVRASR